MKFIQNLKFMAFSFPSLMLPVHEKELQKPDSYVNSSCQKITGMIYQSVDNWCLWIGSQKYTPLAKNSNFFKIESVTGQKIKITFGENSKSFFLHDSFDVKTGDLCP